MDRKRIVIALGGNALGNNLPEQMAAVKTTSKAIVDLIEEGHEVVVCHGNGPQVGMINLAFDVASKVEPTIDPMPLSVGVAMSQGYIGYDLQNGLREEMCARGIDKPVATIITQVEVDKDDPAFQEPTKPIGSFHTVEEAKAMMAKDPSLTMREDAGRGWRQVVASPRPVDVAEKAVVWQLLEAGSIVIACGGGGIPVVRDGNALQGVPAVIDKDFASEKLAEILDADWLIILTAVEKVAINFGKPDQQWLDSLTVDEAEGHVRDGQFAKGSMMPKVQAAVLFARSRPDRQVLITTLVRAKDGLAGKTGTRIG